MKKVSNLLAVGLILTFASSAFAQLTITGELRSKFQTDHGFKQPFKAETDAVFSFDQRTRLNFGYNAEKYNVKVTLQDARVWGADDAYNATGLMGQTNSFGVYEAYADVKIKGNSRAVVGRQEWNYNDGRLLSSRGFWTGGLSYDALTYKMHNKDKGLFVDLGISYNSSGDATGFASAWNLNKIRTINFLNVRKQFSPQLALTGFFSLAGREVANTRDPQGSVVLGTGTHGFILDYNNKGKEIKDGLFGALTVYLQHGTDSSRTLKKDAYKTIFAYMADVSLGFRLLDKKLEVIAGMELISGEDASQTDSAYLDVRHSFDLLYGARFPYYGGRISHFVMQSSSKFGTKGAGYMDPYLKVNFKTSEKGKIDFAVWMPMLGSKTYLSDKDADGNKIYKTGSLGQYIDLGYMYKFSEDVSLYTSFSYAIISDLKNQMVYGYENTANKELYKLGQNYFIYTMLTITPKFLVGEKK